MQLDLDLYADFLRCASCTKLRSVGRLLDDGYIACPSCGGNSFNEIPVSVRTGKPALSPEDEKYIKKELDKWAPHRVS